MLPLNHKVHSLKLFFILFTAILSISFASIFIRLAEAPSMTLAFYRVAIASLLLSPSVIYLGSFHSLYTTPRLFFLVILSGFFLAGHFGFWITSLRYTSIASSVSFVSLSPILVTLFSFIFLKEKSSPSVLTGIIISVIGTIILAKEDMNSGEPEHIYGDLLAFLGALSISGYLIIGRYMSLRIPLRIYVFIVYFTASLVTLLLCLVTAVPLRGFSEQTLIMIILLAVVPQFMGHSLFNWSLKHLPANTVSTLFLGEPVGATILALFLFKEYPSTMKITGLFLICFGIGICTLKRPQG